MPRRHIYMKDKLDKKIEETIMLEIQNGASESDVNYSSLCNELITLGFMIYKPRGQEKEEYNIKELRRDLIRKATGTREGMIILTYLVSEILLRMKGDSSLTGLDELINRNLTQIYGAEDEAEKLHFITGDKTE